MNQKTRSRFGSKNWCLYNMAFPFYANKSSPVGNQFTRNLPWKVFASSIKKSISKIEQIPFWSSSDVLCQLMAKLELSKYSTTAVFRSITTDKWKADSLFSIRFSCVISIHFSYKTSLIFAWWLSTLFLITSINSELPAIWYLDSSNVITHCTNDACSEKF